MPESTLVKLVQVVVKEEQAEEIFNYIYTTADIGRPGGGVLFLGRLLNMTHFALPEGVADEAS